MPYKKERKELCAWEPRGLRKKGTSKDQVFLTIIEGNSDGGKELRRRALQQLLLDVT